MPLPWPLPELQYIFSYLDSFQRAIGGRGQITRPGATFRPDCIRSGTGEDVEGKGTEGQREGKVAVQKNRGENNEAAIYRHDGLLGLQLQIYGEGVRQGDIQWRGERENTHIYESAGFSRQMMGACCQ